MAIQSFRDLKVWQAGMQLAAAAAVYTLPLGFPKFEAFGLTCMAKMPPLIMKFAMPVSPYPTFPRKREKEQTNRFASFTLSSQMQRAAVSIPSNIAEGHARDSTKEFLRFISIAMGSLAEIETQIILAHQLNYFEESELVKLLEKTGEIGRMLRGLQHSLNAKLPNP